MPGRLLDTNAVIALQRGDPKLVSELDLDNWYLCSVVLGELYYGAFRSERVTENLKVVSELATEFTMLTVDARTAYLFGEIHQELRSRGRPIPENDIWIAATARQYQLDLMTRDAHFNEVPGLKTVSW